MRGTKRATAAAPSTATGILTKKIIRQEATERINPDTVGPTSGPTRAGMVNQLIAATKRSRGAAVTTISRPTGVIIAPPAPCTKRAATSWPSDWDRPHSTDPARNTPMAIRNIRRAPNRSATQPEAGANTASVNR